MHKDHKMELLAPAGSFEVLEAVIEAGCDSVYVSGKMFAMRQHGSWLNFSEEELAEAVAYAHSKNVMIYITINNLLTDVELEQLKSYLTYIDSLQPDSLIVQDLGLINLIRSMGIKTPIHASTMMNVHNAAAARHLKALGIDRVITSRDISVHDAQLIKQEADVEVEFFLHNDICVSQGSICYMSGIATENSANRGKCIKPCRWQWNFVNTATGKSIDKLSDQYSLAKKDICLFHQLPELITSGIDAVKIEGRARKADYLFTIVNAYRKAIDSYYANPFGYATDFVEFDKMFKNRVRDYTSNHAFGDTGNSSVAKSGKQEPRFFSIAAEEKGIDDDLKSIFTSNTKPVSVKKKPELVVRCSSVNGAAEAIKSGADLVFVGGEFFSKNHNEAWTPESMRTLAQTAKDHNAAIGLASPRILGSRERFEFARLLDLAESLEVKTILTSNLGSYQFVKEHLQNDNIRIQADFSFNVFNSSTLNYMQDIGIERAVLSPELSFAQVANIVAKKALPTECLVHGSVFGMVLESCLIAASLGQSTKSDACKGYCAGKQYALRDRIGKDRLIMADQYCRNYLLMEKDLCCLNVLDSFIDLGVDALRIEGQFYQAKNLGMIVKLYRQHIDMYSAEQTTKNYAVTKQNWLLLRTISPRDLSYGAYVNQVADLEQACETLPTNKIYRKTPVTQENTAQPILEKTVT